MDKIFILVTIFVVAWSSTSNAETYKCKTVDGKTIYSGQVSLTPGVSCEQIFIRKKTVTESADTSPTSTSSTKPESEEADSGGASFNEDGTAKTAPTVAPTPTPPKPTTDKSINLKKVVPEAKKIAPEEDTKKSEKAKADKHAEQTKQANCENAKTNLKTYQAGGRISKVDEKGERVYLDDAEIKQKTEEAQKEVDKWCN